MDERTDFDELVENVRTQSADAPGSDTERATIRSFDAVSPAVLRELLEALEDDVVAPGALEFSLSPTNADRLSEGASEDDVADVADRLGHPIRVEEGMPDDAILLLDPDAVEGAALEVPHAVACGTLDAVE